MLQDRSIVKIADNSGGQIGRVFKILGGSKKRYAEVGDEVVRVNDTPVAAPVVAPHYHHDSALITATTAARRVAAQRQAPHPSGPILLDAINTAKTTPGGAVRLRFTRKTDALPAWAGVVAARGAEVTPRDGPPGSSP